MIVVKVGGSLYEHPRLGAGLQAYLGSLPEPVLIVPGGGPFADAVRKIHQLDDDAAHLLALHAMNLAGEFLRQLTPSLASGSRLHVIDAVQCGMDLPHSWDVTSDSIAAHAAVVHTASRLVLLKSLDIPPTASWKEAAECGWVDPYFPVLVERHNLTVESVNFRRRLDAA